MITIDSTGDETLNRMEDFEKKPLDLLKMSVD